MRRSKQTYWYEIPRTRAKFERGVRAAHPDVSITPGWRGRDAIYVAKAEIPEFDAREIEIRVRGNCRTPFDVVVLSDSTSPLKHTYGRVKGIRDSREQLCIWHPDDPEAQRWVWEDGVTALFGLAMIHLYKEAYYVNHGEWLGDEAPHPKADDGDG